MWSGCCPGARNRPQPQLRDDWFNAADVGAVLGRHLTPHVKAELELATSTEGRRFIEHYVQVPNYPFPVPIGADQYHAYA